MARSLLFWGIFLIFRCYFYFNVVAAEENNIEFMSKEERENLKEEARDMFYHAYNAYMANAYPADELMPLSCKGRYRGSEANRGDIDSTLGNFSLTLVDTLDTLVVLGDFEEFENAVKLVIKDVTFDTDVIVSLFETNIRMLGGLLSGHILAEYLQQRADIMPWYRGELLNLAKDLGYRFLPAFNTTTGIPYGRINLRHGMKGVPAEVSRETCTACAGSMILEMAALSRLTGEAIFENKAQKAMDVLWRMRHRGTDLMGSVLNVHSGDWVRRDSGVGAGIDSYYEYCLKAYILLGDEKYLGRFNRHYQAVMKYVSQGPMLLDVHMHRPNTNAKNFMDALLAFWPGLQVLKGDIKPAVETHEMLYQVMQRHNFIPEAFTTDFQVHWGHHPLRPEFLESTYFLYRATGDHYYLGVGRKVLKSLQTYARVPCGYAAVSDVRTNKHDDTMDSFVLSETFKYLFLLFAEPSELVLDLDEFIFTTEGHLLPLTLASVRTNVSSDFERDTVQVDEMDRTCPNSLHLFPASVRQPLRNMVEDVCPRRNFKRRLSASQFQANNIDHLKMLSDMGITILTLADGRVQFLHTFSNAKSTHDAEEGLLFMQEMIELSKFQSQQTDTKPQSVLFTKLGTEPPEEVSLLAGPAQFGPELRGNNKVTGKVIMALPQNACSEIVNADKIKGMIVLVNRGNCMFVEKARRLEKAGALAGIVLDNAPASSAITSPMFAMSGDGSDVGNVKIPFVFLFTTEANVLLQAIENFQKIHPDDLLTVTIGDFHRKDEALLKSPTVQSIFERVKGSLNEIFNRQLMSQNSLIGVPVTDLNQNQETILDDVFIADFGNLQAYLMRKSMLNQIRIKAKTNVPIAPKNFNEKPTTFNERQWQKLRQILVDLIYSPERENLGVTFDLNSLTNFFQTLMQERGMANEFINKSNFIVRVNWFLKELSELEPNRTNVNKYHDNIPLEFFKLKTNENNKNNEKQTKTLEKIIADNNNEELWQKLEDYVGENFGHFEKKEGNEMKNGENGENGKNGENNENNLRENILEKILENNENNLRENIREKILINMKNNLRENTRWEIAENVENTRGKIAENLENNLRGNIREKIAENKENLRETVRRKIVETENLRESMREKIMENLENIREKIAKRRENLRDNIQKENGENIQKENRGNIQKENKENIQKENQENKENIQKKILENGKNNQKENIRKNSDIRENFPETEKITETNGEHFGKKEEKPKNEKMRNNRKNSEILENVGEKLPDGKKAIDDVPISRKDSAKNERRENLKKMFNEGLAEWKEWNSDMDVGLQNSILKSLEKDLESTDKDNALFQAIDMAKDFDKLLGTLRDLNGKLNNDGGILKETILKEILKQSKFLNDLRNRKMDNERRNDEL